jgi:cold-inducible RNA-binding protein
MGKKLYVGSLAWATNDDSLREAFEQAGTVESAEVKVDQMSGRSRGFGFVEMGSDEEAQAAIAMWNGKELEGRTLVVNEARPMEDRGPRQGGGGGGFNRGGGGGGFNRGGNGGGYNRDRGNDRY